MPQATVKTLHENLRAAYRNQWGDAGMDRLAKQELEHMFSEFGAIRSSEAITKLIRSEQFFSVAKMREYVAPLAETGHLYDPNCPNCDEGWETVGFSWFDPKYRNKLIRLYGFEEAQRKEARIRCRVCWKGKTDSES